MSSPRQVGETLFQALFVGQVGPLFARSRHVVAQHGQGLRVRLRFRLDPADPRLAILHELPWELLCDPDTGDFLALSRLTPVARTLDVPRPLPPLSLSTGLRVLVAIADAPGHPLDLHSERHHIQEVWAGIPGVELSILDPAGIEALRATLLNAPVHILHLIGMGEIDPVTQSSVLIFPGPDGSRLPVTGETLAHVLKDFSDLRLVFLNACDSFHIAIALVLGGVPAVIAMQLPVADDTAIAFSRAVHGRLAQGDPIDAAVTEGRQAIYALHPETAEWAIPVLFTRIPDGRIFMPSAVPATTRRRLGRRRGAEAVGAAQLGDQTKPQSINRPHWPFPVGQLCGATSDRVAPEDRLGFSHYIEAFADLIESRHTQLPLTVGIFGSWGMGKSFLLEHIEKRLGERQKQRNPKLSWKKKLGRHLRLTRRALHPRKSPSIHIVTFNAWEYSASEAVWPGLVRKVMDSLERGVAWPWPGRFLIKLGRNAKEFYKKERGRVIIISYVAAAAVAATLYTIGSGEALPELWAALLAVGTIGGILKLVADTLVNPVSQWITNLFQGGDYGQQIGQFARIRRDLEFLERQLSRDGGRILILIDDLDRCEPDKAVEMLQAINLLLDFETFIVFLGIDARIVTRAVERHYKGLLSEAGASGYEYLDKIVQIPFRIPSPEEAEIKAFLSDLMGNPAPPPPNSFVNTTVPADAPLNTKVVSSPETSTSRLNDDSPPRRIETPSPVSVELDEVEGPLPSFSYNELQAFNGIIHFLEPNPRHLKRLVNIYRLIRTLATRSGSALLQKPGPVICWVVLCSQWPYTAYRMLRRFEEIVRKGELSHNGDLAAQEPLPYLLEGALQGIDQRQQGILDQDPDLLARMVNEAAEARMSWEDLRLIRRYTINFNPAIEFEEVIKAPAKTTDVPQ